jgi:hypothetical protein
MFTTPIKNIWVFWIFCCCGGGTGVFCLVGWIFVVVVLIHIRKVWEKKMKKAN